MSGGSYSYIYSSILDECENRMYDEEMNDLILDLVDVLHDLEWWQSGDISEEKYRETLMKFKSKWLRTDEEGLNNRLKSYIDKQVAHTKRELYELIGIEYE